MMDHRSSGHRVRHSAKKKRHRPLRLEALEQRQLLTAGILISDADAAEGDTVDFTVLLDNPVPYPVNVDLSTFDGSAVAPNDYGPAIGHLQFAPGQTELTVSVQTVEDQMTEEDEQFHVQLSNPFPPEISVLDHLGVGTIHDSAQSDPPIVSVSVVRHASEDGTKGQLRFTRDQATGWLQVGCVVDQASTASSNDYTQPTSPMSVVFSDGETEKLVDVVAVDDQEPEPTESILVRIQPGQQYDVGQATATVLIQDNDQSGGGGGSGTLPKVTIEATHDASEDGEIGLFTFYRDDTSHFLSVAYVVDEQKSTATAGADYLSPLSSGSVSFLPGQPRTYVDLVAVDDRFIEGTETVVVTVSPQPTYEISGLAEATGQIRDNDVPPTMLTDIAINRFYADGRNLLVDYSISGTSVMPFAIGIYYSEDGQQIEQDRRLLLDSSQAISPGSHTAVIEPRFSDLLLDYYLVAKVDALDQVLEQNEANNQLVFEGGVFVDRDQVVHVHGSDDFAGDLVQVRNAGDLAVSLAYQPRSLPPYLTPDSAPPPFMDVSGDYAVSLIDYSLTANQLSAEPPFRQNDRNIFDVNGDGVVAPLDVLLVLNELRNAGVHRITSESTDSPFVDVSGDNILSDSDAQLMTRYLNASAGNPWTNPTNRFDVDQDDQLSSEDAAIIRNDLLNEGNTYHFPTDSVTQVHVRTHKGDDLVDFGLHVGKETWIFGAEDNDQLLGGSADNWIDAGEGCDRLQGRSANDTLFGLEGDDILIAGEGDDFLRGGEGHDDFDAGTGFDNPEIIDNGQTGFGTLGQWSTRESSGFNRNDAFAQQAEHPVRSEWTFEVPETGWYDVFVTWPDNGSNASQAIYNVWNGTSEHFGPVAVDQTRPPTGIEVEDADWHKLGTFPINQSYLIVQLDGSLAPSSSADGVLVSVGQQPENQPPQNTVPADQQVNENSTLLFSADLGNQIRIDDPDAGNLEIAVSLNVQHGTLSLGDTLGLTFQFGDGTADSSMQFSGSLQRINAALEGMSYAPSVDFRGTTSLQILANDLGHRGTGGPKTDADEFNIDVIAVNHAPIAFGQSLNAPQNQPFHISLTGDDGDAHEQQQLTFFVASLPISGLLLETPSGPPIAPADLPKQLTQPQLVFQPNPFVTGSEQFSFFVKDNGGTDDGGEDTSPEAEIGLNVLPQVSILAVSSLVLEEATENDHSLGQFRVTREHPSAEWGEDLTVNFMIASDSSAHYAPPNGDFEFIFEDSSGTPPTGSSLGSAVIKAGTTSTSISIAPRNDDLVESGESVILQIVDDEDEVPEYLIVSPRDSLIIDDDDTQVVIQATENARETEREPGSFRISLHNGVSPVDLEVEYEVAGTALPGTDYTSLSPTSTIPTGQSKTILLVEPVEDAIREVPDETVAVSLLPAPGRYRVFDPASAELRIEDNDNWTVEVVAIDPIAKETAAGEPIDIGTFRLARAPTADDSLAPNYPLTVDLSIGGTASQGEDYQRISDVDDLLQVIIPAGSLHVDFDIEPINDALREVKTESLRVAIAPRDDAYQLGDDDQATIELHDNDQWIVTVSATDDKSFETGGVIPDVGRFRITRASSTDFTYPLRVAYDVKGTATPKDDYAALSGSVEIPRGSAFVDVEVTPRNDNLREHKLETVRLELIDKSQLLNQQHAYSTLPFEDTGQVTIQDNDDWTVTISTLSPTISEATASPGQMVISRENGLDNDTTHALTVEYQLSPVFDAATNGLDYVQLPGIVTIPAGSLTTFVDISPVNDGLREPDEHVQLQLIAHEEWNQPGYQLGESNADALTIVDNDQWLVSIQARQPLASEAGSEPGIIEFSRQNETDLSWPLSVYFSTSGTAAGNGLDYEELGTHVTIPSGASSTTLEVVPIDDQHREPSESVAVTLQTPPSGTAGGYTIATPGSDTVWIQDNDASVRITPISPLIFESTTESPANILFELVDDPLPFDLTIHYETAGSATNSVDYAGLPGSVVLPAGDSNIAVPIAPVNDNIIEGSESLIVRLVDDGSYQVDGNTEAIWTIEDDDRTSYASTLCWCDFVDFVEQTGASVVQALGGLLNYFSTLNPHPVLTVDVAFPERTLAATHLEAQVRLGANDEYVGPIVVYGADQITEQSINEPFRFALLADASELPTGRHPWSITITEYFDDQDPVTRTYNGHHLIQNRADSQFGNRWAFTSLDKLVIQDDGAGIVKGNGNFVWFSSQNGETYQLESGDGQTVALERIADQFLAQNRDGSSSMFDTTGRLLTTQDRHGRTNTYVYTDADGDGKQDNLIQLVDDVGRSTTFTYSNGLVTAITDFVGRTTSLTYSPQGHLLSLTYPDPDGTGPLEPATSTYAYAAETALMQTSTAEDGSMTTYEYDASGALVSRTGPDNAVERFQAVVTNGVVAPDSNSGTDETPASLLPVADITGFRSSADNITSQFTTDQAGRRTWQQDALGNETVFERAADGQILRQSEPTPDGSGQLDTLYEYDGRGNLLRETRNDGSVRAWTYDVWNHAVSFVDELGRQTLYRRAAVTGDLLEIRLVVGEVDSAHNGESDDSVEQFVYTPAPQTLKDPPAGLVSEFTDSAGRVTLYEYNSRGLLTQTTHAVGTNDEATERYAYDEADNLVAYTDEIDRTTEYEYDFLDRLIETRLPDPDGGGSAERPVIRYEYDARNRRTRTIDPLGRMTRYEYDSRGNLVRIITPDHDNDGSETITQFTYDAVNRLVATTDAKGSVSSYAYDDLDRLVEVNLPLPNLDSTGVASYVYTYDGQSQIASATDPHQNTTYFLTDNDGRTRSTVLADPDGPGPQAAPELVAEYDAAGRLVREVDALGNETRYEYNALDQLIRILQPDPKRDDRLVATAAYTYDRTGNMSASVDARGAVTSYGYDERDRLTSITRPNPRDGSPTGPSTRFTYDDAGQLVSETDAIGATTTYAYDQLGRLSTVHYPPASQDQLEGLVVQYYYDAVGNLVRVIEDVHDVDEDGWTPETTYQYDAHDNLIVTVTPDPDGDGPLGTAEHRYRYDDLGQRIEEVDAMGRKTTYAYDPLGHLSRIHFPVTGESATATEQFRYDSAGNLVQEIDPLGNVSDYEYDGLDRLTVIAKPAPDPNNPSVRPISTFAYDSASRLTSSTDPLGHVTDFEYDDWGRLVRAISPLLEDGTRLENHYEYDAAGNQTAGIDAAGYVTKVEFDFLNRPTLVTQPDPDGNGPASSPTTQMSYDALDRLLSETDALGRTTDYAYDALGQVTHIWQPAASFASPRPETQFRYDALGNQIQATDPLGNTTTYHFDALSQLTEVRQPDPVTGAAGQGPTTRLQYNSIGQLTTIVDTLGRAIQFDYDAADNRTQVLLDGRVQSSWDYDPAGNLTNEVDALGNATHFEYDGLNRLVSIVRPDPGDGSGLSVESTTYDLGDRAVASRDAMGQTTRYDYDAIGRHIRTASPDPDGEGPRQSLVKTWVYDALNNIVEVRDSVGHHVTTNFDSLRRPIATTVLNDSGPETTRYTYDLVGNLTVQADPLGNITTWTYDGLDRAIGETDTRGHSRTVAYDLAGNVIRQTDRNKRTIEFEYDHLNRLTEEQWKQSNYSARTISYRFDDANRLVSVTDPSANYSFAYDTQNELSDIEMQYPGLYAPIHIQQAHDVSRQSFANVSDDGDAPDHGPSNRSP